MANFGATTNWALRKLLGSSNANDIDAGFAALADDVDAKLTPSDQGALASRPPSTPGSPGKIGRTYKATDTGQLFRDNGTGWDEIPLVPIGTADLAAVPGCHVFANSGGQTWAAGTEAVVAMQNETFDTDSMHTGTSATVTIKTAGVFTVTGRLDLGAVTAGGLVLVQILKNGVRLAASQIPTGGQFATVPYTAQLAVSDTLQLDVRNDSSGAIQLAQGELAAVRLSA